MANELKMQVVFSMMEKLTAPLKKITAGSRETGKALKDTSDRLRELNKQQADLNGLRDLHQGMRKTNAELATAKQRVSELAAKMKATESPTRAMTREFNAAVRSVKSLQETSDRQGTQFRALRERLGEAGIGARQLANAQTWLKNSIAATNAELADQQKRLATSARQQQAVANARQRADKLRGTAGGLAAAGVGATAAGAAMGAPMVAGLKEAKHYETENGRVQALGLGAAASAETIKFARDMKTYGTSQLDNLQLLRDGITAFGDTHHAEMVAPMLAKMKFANHAFFGEAEGADNERKFMDMLKVIEMRNGTKDLASFSTQANMVQQVITATGGRVGPGEWLNLIKTGGIAAKGIKDDAFYYQLESLVQEMGGNRVGTSMMSAYQNLYQGRTTKRSAAMLDELGLIGDPSKVKHDKAGQVSYLNPGAIKGADLFRENQFEWMEKVLLPQLASKGITDEKGVLDAIGGIFSNRTAAQLFSTMYQQRTQIHKNEKLNRGAANIDQLDQLGRDTSSGKELETLAKVADLKLELGSKILPLYASGLQMATSAVQSLTGFMERNPALSKAMIVGFSAIAALLVVMGPLMLGLASLIGPYALLQVMFARMGMQGSLLMAVLRGLGTVFMWLGRIFLMNPIGLAITAIAAGAYLIYRYWEPITGFFGNIWQQVRSAFAGGIAGVAALILNWSPLGAFYSVFAGVLSWFGVDLPAKFSDFGVMILRGLANGITSAAGYVKDAVLGAGASVIGWFKEKLDIHSPSRVFAELGDFTMQGLAVGLNRGQDGPLSTVSSLAGKLASAGAAVAIGAGSMPAMAFDSRPPINASAAAPVVYQGDQIQIIVHAAPGMDEQALARAVAAELDRRDLAKAARRRSNLADWD
ncbi:phage tail tape measure protein [Herbaspirillum robiniae]|uniref:phage tail tape measure protein n=1 Tax=Herbaspirillum robiniae TaxID=2014887 RepID=UPI003D778512